MNALPLPTQDDASLAVRMREGDPDAITKCYWRYAGALYRTSFSITLSVEDAEEIVQDVFAGIPEALAHYVERGQLLSWLKRITARRALTRLRERRRFWRVDNLPERSIEPVSNLESLVIREAFGALPEKLRIVIALKVIEGYSHSEIAEILGLRRGTCEVRFHRALKRLKSALEER